MDVMTTPAGSPWRGDFRVGEILGVRVRALVHVPAGLSANGSRGDAFVGSSVLLVKTGELAQASS